MTTGKYTKMRGKRARKGSYERVFSSVPRRAPLHGDERPTKR
jgi:hypothetical protein